MTRGAYLSYDLFGSVGWRAVLRQENFFPNPSGKFGEFSWSGVPPLADASSGVTNSTLPPVPQSFLPSASDIFSLSGFSFAAQPPSGLPTQTLGKRKASLNEGNVAESSTRHRAMAHSCGGSPAAVGSSARRTRIGWDVSSGPLECPYTFHWLSNSTFTEGGVQEVPIPMIAARESLVRAYLVSPFKPCLSLSVLINSSPPVFRWSPCWRRLLCWCLSIRDSTGGARASVPPWDRFPPCLRDACLAGASSKTATLRGDWWIRKGISSTSPKVKLQVPRKKGHPNKGQRLDGYRSCTFPDSQMFNDEMELYLDWPPSMYFFFSLFRVVHSLPHSLRQVISTT